jgi:sulfite reductase (ferredoxin)
MTNTAPAPKETATARVERIKRERASWDIMDDIRRWATQGFDAIPDEDLTVRLRAWGLYTQGDGGGTRGGQLPYFMMRVRTPNGVLTSEQVRTIARISAEYARGTLDITDRQNFQLHWLRIEDVPAIWDALSAVGWTSMGACGDNTRTVTGCPVAGLDPTELTNASALALRIDRALNGNPDFANLPRKFKITVTGCTHWCSYPEINDIGLTATRRDGRIGYHVWVGGGLSTRPHVAERLDAFIEAEQALDVVLAIAAIFRDSDELRQNRAKARMKFLFLNHGWTAERFKAELEARTGFRFAPGGAVAAPDSSHRDHLGVHAQQGGDRYYAGFSVLAGRIGPDRLAAIADLADRHGAGLLRTTIMQNIVVTDIPAHRVDALQREAKTLGLSLGGSRFERGMVACTGSEFCKLALTETKRFAADLAAELTRRLPTSGRDLKIAVTGCPNSCAQHWIADIGLQGIHVKTGDTIQEGYEVFLAGGLGKNPGFAHRVGFKAKAPEIADALERLVSGYEARRGPEETLRAWMLRTPDEELRAFLAGSAA